MRLTLRTLLAYLDNTLDPKDAESLRERIAESGVATQLIQRIQNSLAKGATAAPSAEAVGPVEDANVISEYLDSTLPDEQVAEIERACLESDIQLAEAAACHQILTMVLGTPAEVSPQLRARIYELPDSSVEDIAARSGSFSSLVIPESPSLESIQNEIPTAESAEGPNDSADGGNIPPLGLTDSGVSDAPTRLKEVAAESDASGPATATAVERRHGAPPATYYGNSIRPSRIAPWLVSLALVAVLLFALVRIFSPAFDKNRQAERGDGTSQSEALESGGTDSSDDSTLENAPSNVGTDPDRGAPTTPVAETDSGEPADGDTVEETASGTSETPKEVEAPGEAESPSEPEEPTGPQPEVTSDAPPLPPGVTTDEPSAAASPDSAPAPNANDGDSIDPASVPSTDGSVDAAAETTTEPPDMEADPDAPDPAPAPDAGVSPDENVETPAVATIEGGDALVLTTVDQTWSRMKADASVTPGQTILCAPGYRGHCVSAQIDVTMVGPTQIRWLQQDDQLVLSVEYGRVLISPTEPDVTASVLLGTKPTRLTLSDVDTVFAAQVSFDRAPGADPLDESSRVEVASTLSVRGSTKITTSTGEQTIDAGQQWVQRGVADPMVATIDPVPEWTDASNVNPASLDASAREGLLALLANDQPLELLLLEATSFRKAEVAALAAQTMLSIGRADVYFGGDGVLNDPKQRAYWPAHFQALLDVVDRDAESAASVTRSIANMDSANTKSLQRLLTGFSQNQLVEGADEQLIKLLDSPSMSVRVMALENLRRITGTTLYVRAEQDNSVRRAPGIKKWEVRLRKGDIRWPE